MAAEFKLFSISHALANELQTLYYPAYHRLKFSTFDDLVRDRTYQWGREYLCLKLTRLIAQDDSSAIFLTDALGSGSGLVAGA